MHYTMILTDEQLQFFRELYNQNVQLYTYGLEHFGFRMNGCRFDIDGNVLEIFQPVEELGIV